MRIISKILRKRLALLGAFALVLSVTGENFTQYNVYAAETQPSFLFPSSVTTMEPVELRGISLPDSPYGVLSWSDPGFVPDQYSQLCAAKLVGNGTMDLSQYEGFSEGENAVYGQINVYVKSLECTDDTLLPIAEESGQQEAQEESQGTGSILIEDGESLNLSDQDDENQGSEDEDPDEDEDLDENEELNEDEGQDSEDEDQDLEDEDPGEDEGQGSEDEDQNSEEDQGEDGSSNVSSEESMQEELSGVPELEGEVALSDQNQQTGDMVSTGQEDEASEDSEGIQDTDSTQEEVTPTIAPEQTDIPVIEETDDNESEDPDATVDSEEEEVQDAEDDPQEDAQDPEDDPEDEPQDSEDDPEEDAQDAEDDPEEDAQDTEDDPEEENPSEDSQVSPDENIFDNADYYYTYSQKLNEEGKKIIHITDWDDDDDDEEDAGDIYDEYGYGESLHSAGGLSVFGESLPWYVRLQVDASDSSFLCQDGADIFQAFELSLVDARDDTPYMVPDGEYVTITVPVKAGYDYVVEHHLSGGGIETIEPTLSGSTLAFSTHSFSPFGIAGSNVLVGPQEPMTYAPYEPVTENLVVENQPNNDLIDVEAVTEMTTASYSTRNNVSMNGRGTVAPVQTLDPSQPMLYVGILCGAVVVVLVVLIKKKKK